MNNELLQKLLERYLLGNISIKEKEMLHDALLNEKDKQALEYFIAQSFYTGRFTSQADDTIGNEIKQWLQDNIGLTQTDNQPAATKKPYKLYIQLAVAASILAIIVSLVFFRKTPESFKDTKAVAAIVPKPASSMASLTLGDGSVVALDSVKGGIIGVEGGSTIQSASGALQYKSNAEGAPVFNTVTTPNGGFYQLTLSDNTKVWLNAGSSVKFPTRFTGNQRTVFIQGEAYFEVAHSKTPFMVQLPDGATVKVLGTKFNINSYSNEPSVKTTLVQGSVLVAKAGHHILLKPLQQADIKGNIIDVVKNINIETVLAWKEGNFLFDNTPLPQIMNEFARWYNVEVAYEGPVPDVRCTGQLSRTLHLMDVLNILKETRIRYRLEGKKLIIGAK